MSELYTEPNNDVLITANLGSDNTGLYVRATIYDIQDLTTIVEVVDLEEFSNGLYTKKWTNPGVLTKYWVSLIVYSDSGYTTIDDSLRAGELSINVGRYQGGGYIGATGGKTIIKNLPHELTDKELKQIAKAVHEKIKPELDKKSEFDPKKEIVKIEPINIPEIPEIPKYDEKLLITELKKLFIKPNDYSAVLDKIQDKIDSVDKLVSEKDYLSILNDIKDTIKASNDKEMKIIGAEELLEPIKYNIFVLTLNNNSDPKTVYNTIVSLKGGYKRKAFIQLLNFPQLAYSVAKINKK